MLTRKSRQRKINRARKKKGKKTYVQENLTKNTVNTKMPTMHTCLHLVCIVVIFILRTNELFASR